MTRPPLLMLTHRVPYPPNRGDRIRNFHVLEALATRFAIHLVTFREANEPAPSARLTGVCASVEVFTLPGGRPLSALRGLVYGRSITESHYLRAPAQRYIRDLVATHGITTSWAGSSALAGYLFDLPGKRFVDFMDVDSDKWVQYAARSQDPLRRWLYRREARTIADLENASMAHVDGVFVVAERERVLLAERAISGAQLRVAANGVTAPACGDATIPNIGPEAVVFTGAMDYWPNVDAVTWFADAIWPHVLRARPNARFVVVGSNPTAPVRALSERPGCTVTGTVPEVGPYLRDAKVMVAPLRIARGIQNKVLEGMASGLPVVTTPAGADGIDATPGEHFHVAEQPAGIARHVIDLLADPAAAATLAEAGRRCTAKRYTWSARLAPVLDAVCAHLPATTTAAADLATDATVDTHGPASPTDPPATGSNTIHPTWKTAS